MLFHSENFLTLLKMWGGGASEYCRDEMELFFIPQPSSLAMNTRLLPALHFSSRAIMLIWLGVACFMDLFTLSCIIRKICSFCFAERFLYKSLFFCIEFAGNSFCFFYALRIFIKKLLNFCNFYFRRRKVFDCALDVS